MTQTIRVETFLDVPVEQLQRTGVMRTFPDGVFFGWIDEFGKSHGGNITLTQAALLLFPDPESEEE